MSDLWPLGKIKVGKRARRDMGDLNALADSIREVGLLHPPVVREDGTLIAGARRVAALRKLGFDECPVTVARTLTTTLAALRAEQDENTCRKDFTPTEAVALGKQIEEHVRPLAEAAQHAGRPKKSGQLAHTSAERPSPVGRPRDVAAPAVGMSPRTYEKAKQVVEAAEHAPDPVVRATAAEAAAQMDRTGKVDGAHRKVVEAQNDAALRAAGADGAAAIDRNRTALLARFSKAVVTVHTGLLAFSATHVAEAIEHGPDPAYFDDLASTRDAVVKWIDECLAARTSGLRLVNGGK